MKYLFSVQLDGKVDSNVMDSFLKKENTSIASFIQNKEHIYIY